MVVSQTDIQDVLLVEPEIHPDRRGFFFESWNARTWREKTGLEVEFVQDNHSLSRRGVVRGIHYQIENAQGKLVRVIVGEVFDVAVDLRRGSDTFGRWVGARLSAANKRQLWMPPGFGHGFVALTDSAEMLYKATDYYNRAGERCIRWDDPDLGINWPLADGAMLSEKDAAARSFREADTFD